MLKGWTNTGSQSISSFEKIRTVGKGAYGTAVLYRKKDDDFLVVLKEINIHDLNATERQLAKNEIKVLSMLSHPNIIGYLDSFEEDGTLWIEMEYADGGTLGQYLSKMEKNPDEKEILVMFTQMVSALKYIHEHNILHRDLKTENIFLTMEKKVKLGDFGIAKVMSTRQDADTLLGTPYYISPEMCQGKTYNEKSDIWALGCILYEMASLQKTFEGTNLPALVTKIVKGTYIPIKETFTVEFRSLVRDMLEKEPPARPSAQELLQHRLPELLSKYDENSDDDGVFTKRGKGRRRSLLYFADLQTESLYPVQGLPLKIHINEVAVGLNHVVVVGREHGVFTWGDNTYGQLGLGDQIPRDTPTEIQMLRSKAVIKASCGERFTAFLSDNGLVLTCGDGTFGCLGHNDWLCISRPKLIDDLLTVDVVTLSCGSRHVGVTTASGTAFTWGLGEDGRLGSGNEETLCVPTTVSFPEALFVRDIQCGNDGTVFIMDTGAVFATGKNDYNKLGLNPRQGFLYQLKLNRSSKVDATKDPRCVKDLCKYQIETVLLGPMHSIVTTTSGHLLSIGANSSGQLGGGNLKSRESFAPVKLGIEDEGIDVVALGDNFCMAGTKSNMIYFWGTKPTYRVRSVSADMSSRALTLSSSNGSVGLKSRNTEENFTSADFSCLEKQKLNKDTVSRPLSGNTSSSLVITGRRRTESKSSEYELKVDTDEATSTHRAYLCLMYRRQYEPKSESGVLKMLHETKRRVESSPIALFDLNALTGNEDQYTADEHSATMLRDIHCYGDNAFVLLDTSAPLPKRKKRQPWKDSTRTKRQTSQSGLDESISSTSGLGVEDFTSSEASELDTTDARTWLQKELKQGIPVAVEDENSGDADDSDLEEDQQIVKSRTSASLAKIEIRRPITADRRDSTQSHAYRLLQRIQKKESRSSLLNEKSGSVEKDWKGARPKSSLARTSSDTKQKSDKQKLRSSRVNIQEGRNDNNSVKLVKSHAPTSDDDIPSTSTIKSKHGEINLKLKPIQSSSPVPSEANSRQSPDHSLTAAAVGSDNLSTESVKHRSGSSSKRNNSYVSKSHTSRTETTKSKSKSSRRKGRSSEKDKESSCRSSNSLTSAVKNGNGASDEGIASDSSIKGRSREDELQQEINRLIREKADAEAKLKEEYKEQLMSVEKRNEDIRKEAEARERELKHEVTHLKTELSKQSSKLHENHGILLQLQSALQRMEVQSRSATAEDESKSNENIPTKPNETKQSSSICSVM